MSRRVIAPALLALVLLLWSGDATAAGPHPPGTPAGAARTASDLLAGSTDLNGIVRTALVLTLLALLPALVISTTSFTRIIIVLSMIRHAFGMPETPPNQVLVSLALFLTVFAMGPTFETLNRQALQPYLSGAITTEAAMTQGSAPLRAFMLRQVRDEDIRTVYQIAHEPLPSRAADVGLMRLIPAFILNELRVAFRIGFVVFLPFLLIDIVVSSILLALGMLMVPPSSLSLPIKVLMFVLIDGWNLVLQGVLGSFH